MIISSVDLKFRSRKVITYVILLTYTISFVQFFLFSHIFRHKQQMAKYLIINTHILITITYRPSVVVYSKC